VEVRQEEMGVKEDCREGISRDKLTRYKRVGNEKRINQLLAKDVLDTNWYKKFISIRYGSLKGYEQYETPAARLSEIIMLIAINELLGEWVEGKIPWMFHSFIINQAYNLGVRPLWLSQPLAQAFSKSKVPVKTGEVNRVCPIGLIFFPQDLIKRQDEKSIDWVLFYHRLPSDEIFPLRLTDEQIHELSNDELFTADKEKLYWITSISGTTQSGFCALSRFEAKPESSTESKSIVVDGDKVRETSVSEEKFLDQIPSLIIQTLLYMQIEKITLPPIPEPQPQGFGTKGKTKYQKIPPLIIGENYLIKTQREPTCVSRPHGSPVTHWRSGHWRCQPYGGKDNLAYKTIWIEPILVNKPGG
jgi:hypothetical protein